MSNLELEGTIKPPLADAPLVMDTEPTANMVALKTLKYRFWLAFLLLLLAGLFGVLAVGALAVGQGLAGEIEGGDPAAVILRFDLLTGIFIVLVPTCLWTAYKLRPGGVS